MQNLFFLWLVGQKKIKESCDDHQPILEWGWASCASFTSSSGKKHLYTSYLSPPNSDDFLPRESSLWMDSFQGTKTDKTATWSTRGTAITYCISYFSCKNITQCLSRPVYPVAASKSCCRPRLPQVPEWRRCGEPLMVSPSTFSPNQDIGRWWRQVWPN